MYINEMQIGSDVTIEAVDGNNRINLKSEVVEIDPQLHAILAKRARILPIRLLEQDGMVVSFPKGIKYNVVISSDGNPFIWRELSIQMITHPKTGERYHVILSEQEGHAFNRRENYRLFMGCDGTVQLNNSNKQYHVLVKDISAQGLGFLIDQDDKLNLSIGQQVQVRFEDGVEFNNTKFDLATFIIRIVEIEEENKWLVGCKQEKFSDNLNRYVSAKQRERMKKQRG